MALSVAIYFYRPLTLPYGCTVQSAFVPSSSVPFRKLHRPTDGRPGRTVIFFPGHVDVVKNPDCHGKSGTDVHLTYIRSNVVFCDYDSERDLRYSNAVQRPLSYARYVRVHWWWSHRPYGHRVTSSISCACSSISTAAASFYVAVGIGVTASLLLSWSIVMCIVVTFE